MWDFSGRKSAQWSSWRCPTCLGPLLPLLHLHLHMRVVKVPLSATRQGMKRWFEACITMRIVQQKCVYEGFMAARGKLAGHYACHAHGREGVDKSQQLKSPLSEPVYAHHKM